MLRAGNPTAVFGVCRGRGASLEWSESNTTANSATPLLQSPFLSRQVGSSKKVDSQVLYKGKPDP